jgi:hypothetical protein
MSDASKPKLLESLRAQSTAVRAQGEAARKPVEEVLGDIDKMLWRAFRWLDEALGHLEVIQPVVAHRFHLSNVGTIDRPKYERGFVSYRRRALAGMELLDHVEVFYRLVGAAPLVVRVHPGSSAMIEERLRPSTMPYTYTTEQDERRVIKSGVFHVTPAISANIRFEPDYHRQVVEVTLRNVDRFESVSLEFGPDKLDEGALEDLLKFVLGETNGFLRRAPLAGFKAPREASSANGNAPGAVAQRV